MTTAHSGSGDLNRSLQLLWQGRETATRGPKPGLTLEAIVTAAVGVADREGLAALSMRRVAAELGVGTMSLYRYVPGKGELLDLMLDHVNAPGKEEQEEYRGKHWRPLLELVGVSMFELYRSHPWLLQVNQTRPLLGPNSLLGFDIALSCLEGLGLTGQEKVTIIVTLDSYITGIARTYVLHQQAAEESGITDEEFWAAQAPIIETALQSGCYPHVFQLDEDSFSLPYEDSMRFGLARLLDGLESFIETRRGRQRT
ncbi:TetR/AcrR family transcriptional regulator [Streptomyces sp. B6B3]|uniref:TetR/AcrR family transcriptional regulator n=1 Tax=Streptomyces sp. B6B3 TaxID=3153570 RepID=UPI00325F87FF